MSTKARHILSLSGGKDSTALALYMRDRVPEMEYVFCDTKKELPETYEYLDKIEAYLGKPIVRLCDERGFDHWLEVYGGFLPSSQMRWCTKMLKIRPFEKYVGDDEILMYVGIRADEDRQAYVSTIPHTATNSASSNDWKLSVSRDCSSVLCLRWAWRIQFRTASRKLA